MAISVQDVASAHTIFGLSSDTKPTGKGVTNGDIFIEMDTKSAYFWDSENKKWIKI